MTARVIVIAMQKGGTGKTTTALNLGAALAEKGQRVLAIDLDPQANLTQSAGIDPEALEETIYTAIIAVIQMQEQDVRELIVPTQIGFDLLPAAIDLSLAEQDLHNAIRREYVLSTIIEPLQSLYDFILIDCSPSLGLLVINGLTAADSVLVPVQVEYLAAKSVALLLEQIDRVRKTRLNPDLAIEGILLTMADPRTTLSRQVVEATRQQYGNLRVFDRVVKRSVRFSESTVVGKSILAHDPRGDGAAAYRQLADEVMAHGPKTHAG